MNGAGQPTRLYLVRHAAPHECVAGRCRGRLDVPLSEAGRACAERLATSFAGLVVEAVYASPLCRAVATAEPIARAAGCEVVHLDGLAEIDFGTFEGQTFEEIARAHPALYEQWMAEPTTVRFPGGESYADLRVRVLTAVAGVVRRHPGGAVVAVCHAGPIRAAVGAVLELPEHALFRIEVAYASVTVVEWRGDRSLLLGLNLERAPKP